MLREGLGFKIRKQMSDKKTVGEKFESWNSSKFVNGICEWMPQFMKLFIEWWDWKREIQSKRKLSFHAESLSTESNRPKSQLKDGFQEARSAVEKEKHVPHDWIALSSK